MNTENILTIVVAGTLLVILMVELISTYRQNQSLAAMGKVVDKRLNDTESMNWIEKGITATVPVQTVADMNRLFTQALGLLGAVFAASGNRDGEQFAQKLAQFAGAVTDGKPNVPALPDDPLGLDPDSQALG